MKDEMFFYSQSASTYFILRDSNKMSPGVTLSEAKGLVITWKNEILRCKPRTSERHIVNQL